MYKGATTIANKTDEIFESFILIPFGLWWDNVISITTNKTRTNTKRNESQTKQQKQEDKVQLKDNRQQMVVYM